MPASAEEEWHATGEVLDDLLWGLFKALGIEVVDSDNSDGFNFMDGPDQAFDFQVGKLRVPYEVAQELPGKLMRLRKEI